MNCQCGSAGFWAAILAVALLAIILAQPSLHTWHDNYYAELARINNSTNTESHAASISPSTSSSSSSVTPPPSPPPRPAPLHRFLIATNVDHALAAAQQFPGEYRKEEYVKSIQYLIDHEWTTNPQGIYNLLQHSYMIPNDAKFATLLRGLQEPSDIQYRLAAAVGIQFTPSAYLDHAVESDATFRRLMLDYALDHSSDDFLAARAFLGIKERLRHARDTRFVLTLLSSPINWRNALTWLIKKVETKSDPLTTERLRQLLESAKADDAKGEPVSSEPHTLPWSEPWATRLRDLDIDSVIGTIGPVLDDHIKQMSQGGSTVSRLSQWQEIEIPDYAPLMVGQIDTNGRVQFTGDQIESNEVADTKKSTNVQDDADKPPAVPTFQPDEVLTQSTQVIEEL